MITIKESNSEPYPRKGWVASTSAIADNTVGASHRYSQPRKKIVLGKAPSSSNAAVPQTAPAIKQSSPLATAGGQ
jgi:hypothetical protein